MTPFVAKLQGPRNEAIGALVQPLPVSHLIFRAPSEAAGKCWMDALELSLRCSSLLLRSMTSGHLRSNSGGGTGLGNSRDSTLSVAGIGASEAELSHIATSPTTTTSQQRHWNESDLENHFKDQGVLGIAKCLRYSARYSVAVLQSLVFFS